MTVKWTLEEQWNGWAIIPEPNKGYVRVRVQGISAAAARTALYVAAALNAYQVEETIKQDNES